MQTLIVIDTLLAAMAASNAEITAQVVALNDKLNLAMQRIADLENVQPVARDDTKSKGGIGDKDILRPEKLIRQSDFKEWAEEYHEYVKSQGQAGRRMAELLELAKEKTEQTTGKGETAHERETYIRI